MSKTNDMALNYKKIADNKQEVTNIIDRFMIPMICPLMLIPTIVFIGCIYLITTVHIDKQQCLIKNYDKLCDQTNPNYSEKECNSVINFDGCMLIYNNTKIGKKVQFHIYGSTCVNGANVTCYLYYKMDNDFKHWYVTISKYRILINTSIWYFLYICIAYPISMGILFFVLMDHQWRNINFDLINMIKNLYVNQTVIETKTKILGTYLDMVIAYTICMYVSIIWFVIIGIYLFEPITMTNMYELFAHIIYILITLGPLFLSLYMINKGLNIIISFMFSIIDDKGVNP